MLFLKHHKDFLDARAPPACASGKAFLMLPLEHWNFSTARDSGDPSWSQMARAWRGEESDNSLGENVGGQTGLCLQSLAKDLDFVLVAVGAHYRFFTWDKYVGRNMIPFAFLKYYSWHSGEEEL